MGLVGIGLITAAVILVWSGSQDVAPLDVLRAVLSGQPVPRATPKDTTTGPDGATSPGYDPNTGTPLPPTTVPPGQHLV